MFQMQTEKHILKNKANLASQEGELFPASLVLASLLEGPTPKLQGPFWPQLTLGPPIGCGCYKMGQRSNILAKESELIYFMLKNACFPL